MSKKDLTTATKPEHDDPVDNYEVQGHLRTIMDAHSILQDPDKMKKVHALTNKHSKAIRSIQDLKDARDEAWKPKPSSNPLKPMAKEQDED